MSNQTVIDANPVYTPVPAQKFYTATALKDYGWTGSVIKKHLLGESCIEKVNPHYKAGPKMRLYSLAVIRKIERRKSFKQCFMVASKKRLSADKATRTKERLICEDIENANITVAMRPSAHHVKQAAEEFELLSQHRGYMNDTDDMKKTVNYIRHNFVYIDGVDYDTWHQSNYGKTGKNVAYNIMRFKVDALVEDCAKRCLSNTRNSK